MLIELLNWIYPSNHHPDIKQGYDLLKSKKYQEVLDLLCDSREPILVAAFEDLEDGMYAQLLCGITCYHLQQPDNALECFDYISTMAQLLPDADLAANFRYTARQYMAMSYDQKAEQAYKTDVAKSMAFLTHGLQLAPNNSELLFHAMYTAYYKLQNIDLAIHYCHKVLSLQPENLEVLMFLKKITAEKQFKQAVIHEQLGKYFASLKIITQIYSDHKNGFLENSKTFKQKLTNLRHTCISKAHNEANEKSASGDNLSALIIYKKILNYIRHYSDIAQNFIARIQNSRKLALQRLIESCNKLAAGGKTNIAVEKYETFLSYHPNSAFAKSSLLKLFKEQGDIEKAQKVAEQLKINSNYHLYTANFNRGPDIFHDPIIKKTTTGVCTEGKLCVTFHNVDDTNAGATQMSHSWWRMLLRLGSSKPQKETNDNDLEVSYCFNSPLSTIVIPPVPCTTMSFELPSWRLN